MSSAGGDQKNIFATAYLTLMYGSRCSNWPKFCSNFPLMSWNLSSCSCRIRRPSAVCISRDCVRSMSLFSESNWF